MERNYYHTFIAVAADCPAEVGTIPHGRGSRRTKPELEYELIAGEPYTYTQEQVLFLVHIRHQGIEEEASNEAFREQFFRKPMPCMRASMLAKKYGWGLHFNEEGKVALVPRESEAYGDYVEGRIPGVRLLPAMRNHRQKVEE